MGVSYLNPEASPCQPSMIKLFTKKVNNFYCVKYVRLRSYSVPYFPSFGLNITQCFSR